jgi:hypothetical protein
LCGHLGLGSIDPDPYVQPKKNKPNKNNNNKLYIHTSYRKISVAAIRLNYRKYQGHAERGEVIHHHLLAQDVPDSG